MGFRGHGTAACLGTGKGSRTFGVVSSDGTSWRRLQPIDTIWPATLQVAVAAISSSTTPFTVQFEEFALKAKLVGAGN
jgi:hypothetical protein